MAGVPVEKSQRKSLGSFGAGKGMPNNAGGSVSEACAAFDEYRPTPRPLSTANKGLLSTIETEVIPRLMIAHRDEALRGLSESHVGGERAPDAEDVAEFTRLVIEHEESIAHAYAQELFNKGVSLDSLFLNLLAPAAQLLGEMWENDTADFVTVTIALGRLQHLTHLLRQEYTDDSAMVGLDPRRRALMTSYAGDHHVFGVLMVSEFLRRAEWDVAFEPSLSIDDTLLVVHDQWFAVIGLSLSCDRDPERVRADIRAIRRASRNAEIGIMLGGRMIREHPDPIAATGADAIAHDARSATGEAENLFTHAVSS